MSPVVNIQTTANDIVPQVIGFLRSRAFSLFSCLFEQKIIAETSK